MFSEFVSLPLAVSTFLVFLTITLFNYWKRNNNLPPGPWGLPIFGYYPFLTQKPHMDFAKMAKKYGDVVSFRTTGGNLVVVLNGNRTIKDVLVGRSEEFIGRPYKSNFLEWLSNGLGITQEEDSYWKIHRRFFLQSAKNFGFGKMEIESAIHEEIVTLIEDLEKTKGKSSNIDYHVSYVVSTMISKVMFNKKFEKYGETFSKLYTSVVDLIDMIGDHRFLFVGTFFRYIGTLFLPWSSKVRGGRSFLKRVVEDIIEEHIRTFDPNHLRDYVDSYLFEMEKLRKKGELEKSSFTYDRLVAISLNLLMEGSGPSGVMGLLLEACKHPEEQKKVQQELDLVVGRDRLPSCSDRPKLPYTEAFIQELHRLGQTFYLTNLYSNFEDTKINGYLVPKRSVIVGNLYMINNDPELFPEPEQFDVHRFLVENGNKVKMEGPHPFGVGKRECVGQALAQMEIFLMISSLMQHFTLLPGDKKETLRAIPRN